jgi:hypothetical protein
MTWPSEGYGATVDLGVYYTEDFSGPSGDMPTWAAVNTGLPALDCRHFALDPFDPAGRQYLLLEASRTLYSRVGGGPWAAILTSAEGRTLTGDALGDAWRIWCDPSLAGRLWVTFGTIGQNDNGFWALYSDDYGATWAATAQIYASNVNRPRHLDSVRAYGDTAFVLYANDSGYVVAYSTNKGASWSHAAVAPTPRALVLNPLQPDRVYLQKDAPFGAGTIQTVDTSGTVTALVEGVRLEREDAIWFSRTDPNHQRIVHENAIYVTTDSWATASTEGALDVAATRSIAPWAGDDEDQIVLGTPPVLSGDANRHAISALYGETSTTLVARAGDNVSASPYTGSIPETCGGACWGGVAMVEEFAEPGRWRVYSCRYEEAS